MISELSSLEQWAGGARLDREAMVAHVVAEATRASREEPLFLGLDAPFSLEGSEQAALGVATALDLIAALPDRCPEPEALREAVRRAAEARADGSRERRRPVDELARTPMAPGNLRLYRQTWTALLLAHRLVAAGGRLLPWQLPAPRGPHLLEVCPASLWRTWGLDLRGYKGADTSHRERREALLHGLYEVLPLGLSPALARRAVDQAGGDALDALAVAVGTVSSGLSLDAAQHARLARGADALGGWVYGGAPVPAPE